MDEWNSSPIVKATTSRGKRRKLLTPLTFSLIHATDFTEGVDRGIAGRVKQRQTFLLAPDGDGTRVHITTEVSISGRFATFGQRVIASQADTFADEVAANVSRLLRDPAAGPR